jgi:hypothetical protein
MLRAAAAEKEMKQVRRITHRPLAFLAQQQASCVCFSKRPVKALATKLLSA